MVKGDNNLSKIEMGNETVLEKETLFRFAYIFGKTSPNSKIKNVITITSSKKRIS